MSQSLPLKNQLEQLIQIQENDLKILKINQTKETFPLKLNDLQKKLEKIQSRCREKQDLIDETQKGLKQVLAAIELNQERAGRAEKKSEGVSNNKEFVAASKEVEQLKKHNEQLESQRAEIQGKIDGIAAELKAIEDEKAKIQVEYDSEQSRISNEIKTLDLEVAQFESQKKSFLGKIEPALLARYNRVRVAKSGLGIVSAVDGRCRGCNLMIPPQMYNIALKGIEVVNCPSCHRIVFVPEASNKPTASS